MIHKLILIKLTISFKQYSYNSYTKLLIQDISKFEKMCNIRLINRKVEGKIVISATSLPNKMTWTTLKKKNLYMSCIWSKDCLNASNTVSHVSSYSLSPCHI